MLATTHTAALCGVEATIVDVEVDLSVGLPGYHVVGLPAQGVREGGTRVRTALEQVGISMPARKITVNLAPADFKKEGAAFDLPIALVIAGMETQADLGALTGVVAIGELGLDGSVRGVRGALAAAIAAKQAGYTGIILPTCNASEAQLIDGLTVIAVASLREAIEFLHGVVPPLAPLTRTSSPVEALDMADVRGQRGAKAAAEIAVAGGHNLFLLGPPGIGKTMLARRIPTVQPDMTPSEIIETTKIHSAAGLTSGALVSERPFRAPHHTASGAAIIGGGKVPRPGEISLAHNGVLFLDELTEFPRHIIDSLRQPLEERRVTIHRAAGSAHMAASFLLVAAANPCPCGWLGSAMRECVCSAQQLQRYRARLSGPILDRLDLHVYVRALTIEELRSSPETASSATMRARIVAARERQRWRYRNTALTTNAELSSRQLRHYCPLAADGEALLARIYKQRGGMTARGLDRLVKVARTVADLAGEAQISREHLLDAAAFRSMQHLHGAQETTPAHISATSAAV
ncbi:MAG: YifB family Mg chelatase-like AAA ATPase [Myxococcales bacterium]|nr:YifB family Mg chelatase-like AAA ATPase [Myxococcales bacterium]